MLSRMYQHQKFRVNKRCAFSTNKNQLVVKQFFKHPSGKK